MANASSARVWSYYFSKNTTGLPGASHGSDEAYLLDEVDAPLSVAMASWWAALGAQGDPNTVQGAPLWPAFSEASDSVMDLDDVLSLVANDDTHRRECDFWETWLGYF